MYFKEVEDGKESKETEEFVRGEVDEVNSAEGKFREILRKTKSDMRSHLEERKSIVSNKLKEFGKGVPIHGALLKRREGLEARLKKLREIEHEENPPAQEPPKKKHKRSEASRKAQSYKSKAFPINKVRAFHSFEKTRKECKDFVIFARSPPEFKRESRIVDTFNFEAGKHSPIIAKLDRDSVKRIFDEIVVGINKPTWNKLKERYRSGKEVQWGGL